MEHAQSKQPTCRSEPSFPRSSDLPWKALPDRSLLVALAGRIEARIAERKQGVACRGLATGSWGRQTSGQGRRNSPAKQRHSIAELCSQAAADCLVRRSGPDRTLLGGASSCAPPSWACYLY